MVKTFDTLEQTVAQVCDCKVCSAGGVCDRVKQVTKSIRRIKLVEPEPAALFGRYCPLCGHVIEPKK